MFKTIALSVLVVLCVVVAVVVAIASTRPDDFSVRRSIVIAAPAQKIYPLVADFHRWPQWSPWEKLDPDMKRTYSGPAAGAGAAYAWAGAGKVGSGRMEIKEASAPSKLSIQLDFLKPFEGHNMADFSFAPKAGGTEVTWVMHGPSPFISKVMGVFVSMDTMIGKDFERGLAQMKVAAEQ